MGVGVVKRSRDTESIPETATGRVVLAATLKSAEHIPSISNSALFVRVTYGVC